MGFTKALALEEAAHGITSNAVCPSYVRTALAESQIIEQAKERGITETAALEDVLLQPVAIKRLLEPDEVAELVVYLASGDHRQCDTDRLRMDRALMGSRGYVVTE